MDVQAIYILASPNSVITCSVNHTIVNVKTTYKKGKHDLVVKEAVLSRQRIMTDHDDHLVGHSVP